MPRRTFHKINFSSIIPEMSEKITRREFLAIVASGPIAGSFGYCAGMIETSIGYLRVSGIPEQIYDLYPNNLSFLDRLAEEITPSINTVNFDRFITHPDSGTPAKLIPQPEVFAKSIVRMAYLDGGEEEALNVVQAVKDVGLSVGVENLPNGNAGVASFSIDGAQNLYKITKLEIAIDPTVMSEEEVWWHELYHICQIARDPKSARVNSLFRSFLISPFPPAAISSAFVITGKNFFEKVALGSIAFLGTVVGIYIESTSIDKYHYELDRKLKVLLTHPLLYHLKGQLFNYQP